MSLRWLLRVACDNCGRLSETREAIPVGGYGGTLEALRAALRERGWTAYITNGRGGNHDWCPDCSGGRS